MFSAERISSIVFCLLALNFNLATGDTFGSKIVFYNGDTNDTYTTHDLTTAENVVNDFGFDLARTTVIYIHGWNQSYATKTSQVIANSYISNGNYNILMLDWSGASTGNFPIAASRVDEVGSELALYIDRMNRIKGLQFSKLHLVGHSLGAHLAGKAGKYTLAWSQQTKSIDSHVRSIYFWAESVLSGNHTSFLSMNRANPNIIIPMGNNCPTSNVQGVYDLTTSDSLAMFSMT